MLPLSTNARDNRSLRKPKRSRAGASHPRPNLRAPLSSSYLGLYPYDSHSPSHRVPSSTTQAHFWRASGASRLSARSREPHVFIEPSKRCNSPTHLNTFHYSKCLKQIFHGTSLFGHQNRHHASSFGDLVQAGR